VTSKSWLGSLSCFTRTKRERHNITPYSESHRVGVRTCQLRVILIIPQIYMKLEGSTEPCILNGHAISDVMVVHGYYLDKFLLLLKHSSTSKP
jgi:hypothetical protein